jgi:hypothetical protein
MVKAFTSMLVNFAYFFKAENQFLKISIQIKTGL